MPIIGSTDTFAIQWKVHDGLHIGYVYLSVWIAGKKIGALDDAVSIATFVKRAENFQVQAENRYFINSETLTGTEIFRDLYDSCVITALPGQSLADAIKLSSPSALPLELAGKLRDTFYLDEVFGDLLQDTFNLLLVAEPVMGRERLILRDLSSMEIAEYFLPAGEVEHVMKETLSTLESLG